MLSSTWRSYLRFSFAVHLSTFIALFLCYLVVASPASGQVTSSPTGVIFSAPGTATLTITVPSGTTLGSATVLTLGAPNLDYTAVASGTTCPNVTSGTCAVEVQFAPTAPGRRQGSVVLNDPNGNTLLNISLDGAGSFPVAGFAPRTISTFAGGGTGGSGGLATSAKLAGPAGITVDGFGNHYIVDEKGNMVWKVTPAGVISTFAGTGAAGYSGDSGPATSAQLNGPMDVVVDGAGFVYISDTNNNVVRMVNTAGIISTYAGQYYAPGTTPPPVCAAATNTLGDGCLGNQMILNTPVGLIFCHAQNLHIADKLNNRVRTVNRVGYNTITQVGDGVAGYNGDGEDNTSAELNGPMGLDMDAANYIYVADSGNHIIRKTLLTGTIPNPIATVAGTPGAAGDTGDGGSAISAELNNPFGVRVDAAGDIYIVDSSSNVVRKVNAATGMISTIVGTGKAGYTGDGGSAGGAQLNSPANIGIDENGNIYIADFQNAVIRKVDFFDAPSLTFASTPVGGGSAPQDITAMNMGSAALNITQITTSANYSLGGADTSCKPSGDVLNPATACILGVEFNPTTTGSLSGSVVLTDDSNPTSQKIALSGTGSATPMAYTVTDQTPTVSIVAGGNGTGTLILNSTNYAGTVSFTSAVSSTDGTAADVTASASSVTLAPGGTATSTVTIAATAQAATRTPPLPWNGGTAIFCAALFAFPFAFRRRRTISLLLFALAIAAGGSLMACGGTTSAKNQSAQSARTYMVTVTPKATLAGPGTVTNPSPVTITVTVQ